MVVVQTPTPTGPTLLGVMSRPIIGRYSIDGQRKSRMDMKPVEVTPGQHTIYIEIEPEDGPIRSKEIPVLLNAGEKRTVCWNFATNTDC